MIEKVIVLMRRLGHFPTSREIDMERRSHPGFPAPATFRRKHLGQRGVLAARILTFCDGREGYEDIVTLCSPIAVSGAEEVDVASADAPQREGTVYLIKSGMYYKIGRAFTIGRREREIALQLPEQAVTIHTIATDDPVGIEAYWHKRFEAKRQNGEWFALTPSDVRAFRRRKNFM
jgi:hypothetical protein